jgi:CheY-like chemotaxis protein
MAQAVATVLVVDDDADSRAFVAMVVGMLGLKVLTASDGEEGLALARDHQPSLILLDVMMPGMDGFSFREAQLQAPELAEIPVLVMSALREEQLQPRLGAVPALSKPVEIDELITQVKTLCKSSPAQRCGRTPSSTDG